MYFFFIKTILVFLEAQKVLLSETSHYSCRVCRGKDRNRQYRIVRTDSLYIQTQLPQPFPWKRCFDKICKIRRRALVLESHLIKLYVYSVQIYLKKRHQHWCFLVNLEKLQRFYRTTLGYGFWTVIASSILLLLSS